MGKRRAAGQAATYQSVFKYSNNSCFALGESSVP
jgi:hypothetical protein